MNGSKSNCYIRRMISFSFGSVMVHMQSTIALFFFLMEMHTLLYIDRFLSSLYDKPIRVSFVLYAINFTKF